MLWQKSAISLGMQVSNVEILTELFSLIQPSIFLIKHFKSHMENNRSVQVLIIKNEQILHIADPKTMSSLALSALLWISII